MKRMLVCFLLLLMMPTLRFVVRSIADEGKAAMDPANLPQLEQNVPAWEKSWYFEYESALHRLEAERGPYKFWTIHEQYEFNLPFHEYLAVGEGFEIPSLPKDDELMQEEALALARAALTEKYGEVKTAGIEEMLYLVSFLENGLGLRFWHLRFLSYVLPDTENAIVVFDIRLEAKTGEVLFSNAGEVGWG